MSPHRLGRRARDSLARFITLAARARNEFMGFCELLKGVWQGPSRLDELEISSTAKLPTKD